MVGAAEDPASFGHKATTPVAARKCPMSVAGSTAVWAQADIILSCRFMRELMQVDEHDGWIGIKSEEVQPVIGVL